MKQLAVGILAHVDAGKTTLSEGMLYLSGSIQKLGRVDHKDAFLDTARLERERGITIFSKQALLKLPHTSITLLDTPGHVDFSAEMERTLRVLDYAVLVISGSDGIQGHTETLWQLLQRYRIPTFLFINKMDLPGADRAALLQQLRSRLSDGCVDFSADQSEERLYENAALCSEPLMDRYLQNGSLTREDLVSFIARRSIFPCYFGAALRLEGISEFLEGLDAYTRSPEASHAFGARVFKITRDAQGQRLTHMKITGGSLRVKSLLTNRIPGADQPEDEIWSEKADQLRLYTGEKYTLLTEATAGCVCAVTGLTRTFPGQGLGVEESADAPILQPVLTYRILVPDGQDAHSLLPGLRQLEEEDPQLHLVWNDALKEIHLQLMGEVQLDILREMIRERLGFPVEFDAGSIVYKETISRAAEGIGHFEPLRHYAEVHLLLQPGEPGSGIVTDSVCSEDVLDKNWQRLILTHLNEREHPGVLTGAPLTDVHITLLTGRAHLKHTEGGDFRQATYRAVRQGLMQAESVLLEPWYKYRLKIPAEQVGRALADLQRMNAEFSAPETQGDSALLTGIAPAATMQGYSREVAAYSHGHGQLSCTLKGYFPCHNAAEVIAQKGYDPDRDTENPTGSVFCAHGAGYNVSWDQVPAHAHLRSVLERPSLEPAAAPVPARRACAPARGSLEEEKELLAIFEREFGPIRRKNAFAPVRRPRPNEPTVGEPVLDFLLVDGYNIIFAWDELKELARENLDAARKALIDLLCSYQGFCGNVVILVFDAYRVHGNPGSVEKEGGIYVVYTREAETADMYIEKATYQISRRNRVRVATSDGAEQMIILGHGAMRISARMFREEVELQLKKIRDFCTPPSGDPV